MNPEDPYQPAGPACDCPVCKAGLTPDLLRQEHAALHSALLLATYVTATPEVAARPDYQQMLTAARIAFREDAAALGATWTLAQAIAQ